MPCWLAHEIAHVEHRHPIQALERGAVSSLVWAALAGATGQSAVQNVLGNARGAGMIAR